MLASTLLFAEQMRSALQDNPFSALRQPREKKSTCGEGIGG
jgi:hypothetical protein